jgi:Meckel syndrome type 1 protein
VLAVGVVALVVDPLVVPVPAAVLLIAPVVDSVVVDPAALAAPPLFALVASGVASPPAPTPLSRVPPLLEAASPAAAAAVVALALPALAAALSLGWAPAEQAKATPMPIATRIRLPGGSSLAGFMKCSCRGRAPHSAKSARCIPVHGSLAIRSPPVAALQLRRCGALSSTSAPASAAAVTIVTTVAGAAHVLHRAATD